MTDSKTISHLLRAIAIGTDAKKNKHDVILTEAADMIDETRFHTEVRATLNTIRKHLVSCLHDTVSPQDIGTPEECQQWIIREIIRYAFDRTSQWSTVAVENTFVNTYYQISAGRLAGEDFSAKFSCIDQYMDKVTEAATAKKPRGKTHAKSK